MEYKDKYSVVKINDMFMYAFRVGSEKHIDAHYLMRLTPEQIEAIMDGDVSMPTFKLDDQWARWVRVEIAYE